MSDITMCLNPKDCPKKERCWRTKAQVNPYRQSYSNFYEADKECEYFMEIKNISTEIKNG